MTVKKTRTLDEEAEFALTAMRRGIEKATRQQVLLVEELQSASNQLRNAGFQYAQETEQSEIWRASFEHDPVFALAFIRVELERNLQRMATRAELSSPRAGAIDHLWNEKLLSSDQAKAMAELLHLLNTALHGAAVDPKSSEWALTAGLGIVQALAAGR